MSIQGLKRRQLLKIVSESECKQCFGSGLMVSNKHSGDFTNTIEIKVMVCECVRVMRHLPKHQSQPRS